MTRASRSSIRPDPLFYGYVYKTARFAGLGDAGVEDLDDEVATRDERLLTSAFRKLLADGRGQ